ncbi:hypothetical protein, partial [Thiolapillus sp.]
WGGGRDLYGSAHRHPKGTIWLQWLMASFPWGLIAIGLLLGKMVAAQDRKTLKTTAASPLHSYLLSWALFTPLFFTPAGNVLCTYLLPALPALALILAMGSGDSGQKQTHGKRRLCCPVPRSIALFGRIRICHAATRQRQNRKRIGGLRKQSIGQCQR